MVSKQIFAIYVFVCTCNAYQRLFRKMKENCDTLATKDIISSHAANDLMECSMECLQQKQCVSFNFLYMAKEFTINCQTSNTTFNESLRNTAPKGKWAFFQSLTGKFLVKSCILNGEYNWIFRLKKWLPSHLKDKNTMRCYQATVNGWKATTFHSLCDFKGPTLVVVKVGSYVFGGFASESWGGMKRFIRAEESFIFSMKNKDNLPPFKSDVVRRNKAMYTVKQVGPIFGNGHDLHISNDANTNFKSHTGKFGYSYRLPNGYSFNSTKTQVLLAGSYYFTPDEVEVFYFSSS
ncbi:uncharacterized protein LOC124454657 [Xenia sp. Carnegie-2017]|uniref:uncharacterized protein LOC124454657 n=1 Tax=Xenia sp. Carnegie-2017 TaxID=2897299 RepID=UPI001F036B1A|nr:uncharacterized protein LOC124454657 [Xenia sp. Carnegie-2017]